MNVNDGCRRSIYGHTIQIVVYMTRGKMYRRKPVCFLMSSCKGNVVPAVISARRGVRENNGDVQGVFFILLGVS